MLLPFFAVKAHRCVMFNFSCNRSIRYFSADLIPSESTSSLYCHRQCYSLSRYSYKTKKTAFLLSWPSWNSSVYFSDCSSHSEWQPCPQHIGHAPQIGVTHILLRVNSVLPHRLQIEVFNSMDPSNWSLRDTTSYCLLAGLYITELDSEPRSLVNFHPFYCQIT